MAAGFEGFEVTWSEDIFEGAKRPSAAVASFGTRGLNFRARRPEDRAHAPKTVLADI